MSSPNSVQVSAISKGRFACFVQVVGLTLLFLNARVFGCGSNWVRPAPPGAVIWADNGTIAVGQSTGIHADFGVGSSDAGSQLTGTNIESPEGTPAGPEQDGTPQAHRDHIFTPTAPGYYTFYARINTPNFPWDTYGTVTVNVIAAPRSVAAPTFSQAGGTYAAAQSVVITSPTSGATIVYTTDGSTPSETNGTVYSGPVPIIVPQATTTLQAMAYESGYTDSAVTSATYVITTGTPQSPTALVPLYQFVHPYTSSSWQWEPDLFLTTNYSEGNNAAWYFSDVTCTVDASPDTGTIPLYRYFFPGHSHYYTTNFTELGRGGYGCTYEGIACYVWPNSLQFGTVPLYRFRDLNDSDRHYYSINSNGNLGSNFVLEGIQCYVMPAAPPGQLPPLSTSSFAALNALIPPLAVAEWIKLIGIDDTSNPPGLTPPFYQADAKYIASWINSIMPDPSGSPFSYTDPNGLTHTIDSTYSTNYQNPDGTVLRFSITNTGPNDATVTEYSVIGDTTSPALFTFPGTVVYNIDGSRTTSFTVPPDSEAHVGENFQVTSASAGVKAGDGNASVAFFKLNTEDGSTFDYSSDGTGHATDSHAITTTFNITQPDANGAITFTTVVPNPGWGNGIVVYIFHQDGTSFATTRDDLGNVIAANYDASGTLVGATYTPYNDTPVAISPVADANGEEDYMFSNGQHEGISNQDGFGWEFYLDSGDGTGISNVQINDDGIMTFTQTNSDHTSTNWTLTPLRYNPNGQLVIGTQSTTNGVTKNDETAVSTFGADTVANFGIDNSSDPWPSSWGNNPFSSNGGDGNNGSAE